MTLDEEGMEAIRASQGTQAAQGSSSGAAAAQKLQEAGGAEAEAGEAPFVVYEPIVLP